MTLSVDQAGPFPALTLCPACAALLFADVEPATELIELHYYARSNMRHVVAEEHECRKEAP